MLSGKRRHAMVLRVSFYGDLQLMDEPASIATTKWQGNSLFFA
jgi:hypothetical protein